MSDSVVTNSVTVMKLLVWLCCSDVLLLSGSSDITVMSSMDKLLAALGQCSNTYLRPDGIGREFLHLYKMVTVRQLDPSYLKRR